MSERTGYVVAEISQERTRQVREEGYSPEHDDIHDNAELATAAACYCRDNCGMWPWDHIPDDLDLSNGGWPAYDVRRHQLVKAGALIVAEIERLDRLEREAGR